MTEPTEPIELKQKLGDEQLKPFPGVLFLVALATVIIATAVAISIVTRPDDSPAKVIPSPVLGPIGPQGPPGVPAVSQRPNTRPSPTLQRSPAPDPQPPAPVSPQPTPSPSPSPKPSPTCVASICLP